MKKFAASVGLIALGTTAIHAAESSALNSMQNSKAWSVSASLRGFYDDNVNTQTKASKIETFGIEVSPSVDYGYAGEQTSFNLGYTFGAKWYDKSPNGGIDHWDYTHSFDADLAHAFSPRAKASVSESFGIGQEPDFLRQANSASATPQRISGDNIRNNAGVTVDLEATELLGFTVSYLNGYYNYAEHGGTIFVPSQSALLDRVDNTIRLDSRWKIRPTTTGILGYTFSQIAYTGDEPIGFGPLGTVNSDQRNSRGHIFYVGAQHAFTPSLTASLNVGGQYTDYYKDSNSSGSFSPYVASSLSYAFQSTTTFDLGFSYQRSAADSSGSVVAGSGDFVKDTEVALVYGSVTHEIIPHLKGSAKATLQNATYNGGGAGFDGKGYMYYQLGLDLAYEINPNLATHLGYNFDKSDSDLAGRSYDRNRVYLGVTATY